MVMIVRSCNQNVVDLSPSDHFDITKCGMNIAAMSLGPETVCLALQFEPPGWWPSFVRDTVRGAPSWMNKRKEYVKGKSG
jgi:hypothetical protein